MLPMLPSERKLEGLRPLAAEVIAAAGNLAGHGMPQLRLLLREALRPMNAYYTNKIEGQQTEPLLLAPGKPPSLATLRRWTVHSSKR